MTPVLAQGLMLSVVGLGLTFSALGLFILAILALRALFDRAPASPPEAAAAGAVPEAEVVAAIVTALEYLRAEAVDPSLGRALETGRGPWWSGRETSWTVRKDRHGQP